MFSVAASAGEARACVGGLRPPAVLVPAAASALQTVRLSAKSDEEG